MLPSLPQLALAVQVGAVLVRHVAAVPERGAHGAALVLLERAAHGARVGAHVAARAAHRGLLAEVIRERLVSTSEKWDL